MKGILIVMCAMLAGAGTALGQSTAFTYHGRLGQNGAAANGNHDMQFVIYTSQNGNNAVTQPLPLNEMPVNNGLFTARLDFGAGIFTGAERWLEVRVRKSGNGQFETLAPRHELTSSPYAIRAITAGSAEDVANGSVVKSLNNLRDHVSLTAGANITLTPNGNALTISAVGGGAGGDVWSVFNNNAFYTAGNVGIGTDVPRATLDVRGSIIFDPGGSPTLFTAASGAEQNRYLNLINSPDFPSASGLKAGGILVGDSYGFANPGKNDLIVKGFVGIGTGTPVRKLTVFEPNSRYGIEHTDGNVRLGTYLNSFAGWLGTISNHKLQFFVADGGPSMAIDTTGNVGIGTDTPTTKLDVVGDVRTTRLVLRRDPLAPANAAVLCEDPNVANFVPFNTALGQPLNVIARQLTITGGADFAEPFNMSHEGIAPGSVVVIDENTAGSLKLSTQAYDTRVAGVVSGANGIKPGISLRQEGVLDEGENVALSGRVYVQVDASFGAIKPGDLLTTSETPGHAMKVRDHTKAQGAILGKAMTGLKEGKGTVLILVTLQ
jgi:hypothetical protein